MVELFMEILGFENLQSDVEMTSILHHVAKKRFCGY